MSSDPGRVVSGEAVGNPGSSSSTPYGDHPVTMRRAGAAQGICILLAAMLPAMGVTLLSPSIPAITQIFSGQPGSAYLVSIALTIPSLAIAMLSGFAGLIVDRFGRRVCLLTALALYAVFGVFPALSTSLLIFIILRGLLGVVEAVIMTATLTLIADYFDGDQRSKWLAYSTGFTAVMAVVVYTIAGALGELGWQYPFFFYGIAALIFLLALKVIWEPSRTRLIGEDDSATPGADASGTDLHPVVVPKLFDARFVVALILSVLGGALFFVIPLQLATYLGEHGATSPALIGALIAVATIGNAIGALGFRFVAHLPVRYLVAGSMGLSALGLLLLPFCTTAPTITAAAFMNQLGAGIFPPLFMAIVMGLAPVKRRGRAGGLFWSSFSIGNFVSPIIMLPVVAGLGSLGSAFVAVAIASILIAAFGLTPAGNRLLKIP